MSKNRGRWTDSLDILRRSMVKKGYERKIYATKTTCKLLPLSLTDSHKVLKDLAKRKHVNCLYEESHVNKTLELLKLSM